MKEGWCDNSHVKNPSRALHLNRCKCVEFLWPSPSKFAYCWHFLQSMKMSLLAIFILRECTPAPRPTRIRMGGQLLLMGKNPAPVEIWECVYILVPEWTGYISYFMLHRENAGTLRMEGQLFNLSRSPLKGDTSDIPNKYPLWRPVYMGLII